MIDTRKETFQDRSGRQQEARGSKGWETHELRQHEIQVPRRDRVLDVRIRNQTVMSRAKTDLLEIGAALARC